MHRFQFGVLVIPFFLSLSSFVSATEPDVKTSQVISMTSSHWHPVSDNPDVQCVIKEGFSDGIIVLKSGDLALNELSFRDGTIEFDMKPLAEDIPGIRFRQRDHQNGEEFYIRSFPDCRAENDCIQYSPVINGFMLWNVYPEYQKRELVAVRPLWQTPIELDNTKLVRFLGEEPHTSLENAMTTTLRALSCIK